MTEAGLHKKWSFPLGISSVSAVYGGFGHIYQRNPYWEKVHFLHSATIHSFLQSKYSYEFSQNLYEKELYEEEIPAQVFSCAYCEIL